MSTIDSALATHLPIDATPTWVLSNHDVTRPVTRYGREDTAFSFEAKRAGLPTDLERGLRRARAAALLTMALPGSLYVYQGEELGLPEVEDIPNASSPGPDACSVGRRRSRAVTAAACRCRGRARRRRTDSAPTSASSWLDSARRLGGADRRGAGRGSQIRRSISIGRVSPCAVRRRGARTSQSSGCRRLNEVLAFRRGPQFMSLTNFGSAPVPLPAGTELLLASSDLQGGAVPQDTTVWLSQTRVTSTEAPGKEGR